ncbi:MAG: LysE family translocator [Bacteroidota bacterium]
MNLVFDAMYKGFALGMALCISIGPAFFALIQSSLKNGYRSGIALALGIFLSDTACVALAYLGASSLFAKEENKTIIGVIGGTILLVFGIYNIFQKKSITEDDHADDIVIKKVNLPFMVLKGFFLNILNPFVILLWIGWVGLVSSREEYTHVEIIIFFVTTLATVLATDILKALAAGKIKKFLNARTLALVNRLVGLIMAGCGVWMMYRVF